MFSLESPHRGDSNEYTQYTIFHIKIIPNLQLWDFLGAQARVLLYLLDLPLSGLLILLCLLHVIRNFYIAEFLC